MIIFYKLNFNPFIYLPKTMQDYTQTDQQIHWLCQIIAKANRSYVPKKEDDSHTNLFFDVLGNRIIGRWIKTSSGKIILSLNLENLHLEWLGDHLQVLQSVASVGKSDLEIIRELTQEVQKRGLQPADFSEKLHFEITEYPFSQTPVQFIPQEHIQVWKHWRQLANEACLWVLGYLQADGEIRIWPHHFDTGIYVPANDRVSIGFGWAMEDSLAGAPYFYVAGYASQGSLDYQELPELQTGKWETSGHFKGAILSLNEMTNLNRDILEKALFEFLQKTIGFFLK